MPTYGRGFNLANSAANGVGAAASGGSPAGPYTGEAGFLAYYEVSDDAEWCGQNGLHLLLFGVYLLHMCNIREMATFYINSRPQHLGLLYGFLNEVVHFEDSPLMYGTKLVTI